MIPFNKIIFGRVLHTFTATFTCISLFLRILQKENKFDIAVAFLVVVGGSVVCSLYNIIHISHWPLIATCTALKGFMLLYLFKGLLGMVKHLGECFRIFL